MSEIRRKLLLNNNEQTCDFYIPLINGDFNMYNLIDSTVISPNHAKCLSSNLNGTSFNRTKGHGVIYRNMPHDIKTISLEYYVDPSMSGRLSNSWGGIFILSEPSGSVQSNRDILTMAKSPYFTGYSFHAHCFHQDSTIYINAETGKWHKMCVTSNYEDDKNYTMYVYVDGVYLGSNASGRPVPSYLEHALTLANSWRLIYYGVNSTNANPLCGTLRNIRIFKKQFSEEEAIIEST